MTTTPNTSLLEMLQAGVHFGHKTSKKHPKMDQFLFGAKHGISIIDLEKTQEQLVKILPVIENLAAQGKTVLYVGTKQQAKDIIKKASGQVGMPYMVERWLGGLLTNFSNVSNSMRKLSQLKEGRETGNWEEHYTKKERLVFEREIERLTQIVGGIETMARLPDMVFVVDCKKEKTAIQEAMRLHIPIVAMVDSNVNPAHVTYPIPANDDGIKSVQYIVTAVTEAIARGKAKIQQPEPTQPQSNV